MIDKNLDVQDFKIIDARSKDDFMAKFLNHERDYVVEV